MLCRKEDVKIVVGQNSTGLSDTFDSVVPLVNRVIFPLPVWSRRLRKIVEDTQSCFGTDRPYMHESMGEDDQRRAGWTGGVCELSLIHI